MTSDTVDMRELEDAIRLFEKFAQFVPFLSARGSCSSVIRGAFLGSKIVSQASETIRGQPRPPPIRAIPRL